MNENEIKCPHCECINEPLDDETTNIAITEMKCESCEENFYMSRVINIAYETFT